MIEWIFFDVGSTLFDEDLCHEKRFLELESEIMEKYGRMLSYKDEIFPIMKEGGSLRHRSPALYASEKLGISFPRYPREHERLYPNVKSTLDSLYGKYKLGVIANQPKGLGMRLDEFGIGGYFDIVIGSDDVGISKPDERIFSLAISRAGVPAERCVMVGDMFDNDIIPAKTLGMRTVRVALGLYMYDAARDESERPDASINDITELAREIAKI